MKKTLTLATQSNYEITLEFWPAEKAHGREHVLQHFAEDMNIPGFRPGNVPLHIVEQKVDPKYVEMAIVEDLVNHGLQELLAENPELKFIWEPYNFKTEDAGEITKVTFSLDLYPEVTIEWEKWKSEKIAPIAVKVEKKELEDSLLNIRKNYADYQDAEAIDALDTIAKLGLEFLDQKDENLEKGSAYLGEPEFLEDPFWKKTFEGKKKWEVIELVYESKKLPATLQSKHADTKTLKVTIQDIKKVILPELNDEMIAKLFGKDAEVKTYVELETYVKNEIEKQKHEHELIHAIENYIWAVRKAGIEVKIPQTIIQEEFKVRMKNLEERFGSAEKVQEYLTQLGDQATAFTDNIKTAANESLEKFFILNKVAELLDITIDRSDQAENLAVEKQLYNKLVDGSKTEKKASVKKIPLKKNNLVFCLFRPNNVGVYQRFYQISFWSGSRK